MTAARRLTLVMPASVMAMTLRQRIDAGDAINFLIARVGRERFALDLGLIQEVVDAAELERVPQLPYGAIGLLRWRGIAHTVWSPAPALRVDLDRGDIALFLKPGLIPVAVAVDDIDDLITVSGSAVRALPGVEDGGGLVLGVLRIGETLATVLDIPLFAAAVRGLVGAET